MFESLLILSAISLADHIDSSRYIRLFIAVTMAYSFYLYLNSAFYLFMKSVFLLLRLLTKSLIS